MIKCLLIGDSHIPRRAKEIPTIIYEKIKSLSEDSLFDYTFFTGDLIKAPDLITFLTNRTSKDVFIVIGNMDYYDGNRNAPVFRKLDLNLSGTQILRIGLTHGAEISPRGDHDQLEILANEKDCNILISGHTHHEEIYLGRNGVLLLNPGSVTGAWSFVASGIPSFITLDLDQLDVKVTLFQLDRKSNMIDEKRYYFIFSDNKINHKY